VGTLADANATEERCFLHSSCRDVISRAVSEVESVSCVKCSEESRLVSESVRELLGFSRCELLLFDASS
jgi:hypothetical protein